MNLTKTKTTTQPLVVKELTDMTNCNGDLNIHIPNVLTPITLVLRGDNKADEIPMVFRKDLLDNFVKRHTDDDELVTDCDWCINTNIIGHPKDSQRLENGKGVFYIGHGETIVSRTTYNIIKLQNDDGQVAIYNLRTRQFNHIDGNVNCQL